MALYDFVIIGSGLGGLECAYTLSKEGYKVCVLEKNRQLGGNLQIFSRDKVIFDTGVHYIGGLDPGQNLHQFFRYYGLMDKLKLKRMDPNGFDRITFDGDEKEYPHAMGYENFAERLLAFFPKEKTAIDSYCDKIQKICDAFPVYRLRKEPFDALKLEFLEVGAKNFIDSLTSNKKLRSVLAGSNPLYAGDADKTPLYAHALTINTYIESAWKCVDGGAQISNLLAKSIREMGGDIFNYAEVTKFTFNNEKAIQSVETADGRVFEGRQFISNIHPTQTLKMIPEGMVKPSYRKRLVSLDNSISVFTVHLVFKPESFPYLNYNYYHSKTADVWAPLHYKEEDWPENYILFVPATTRSDKYAEGMNIMSYMRYEEVKPWEDTYHTIPKNRNSRGQDYEEWKDEKAQRMITELEKKFPGIRAAIKSYYTSTPLSYRDYIGTSDGSMYGIVKDYNDPWNSFISPRTKVPNLYWTGQNLNMHGILGVTVSSLVTCARFLGMEYLIEKIKDS